MLVLVCDLCQSKAADKRGIPLACELCVALPNDKVHEVRPGEAPAIDFCVTAGHVECAGTGKQQGGTEKTPPAAKKPKLFDP